MGPRGNYLAAFFFVQKEHHEGHEGFTKDHQEAAAAAMPAV